MTFNILLTIALAVCLVGLLARAVRWFTGGVTASDFDLPAADRLSGVALAGMKSLFGANMVSVIKGLVFDGLFQVRLLRADRSRWVAHILIFWGFMPLLVFHALDGVITKELFPGYESTLNPWPLLRNLFGLMVVAGLTLAVRRRFKGRLRLRTTAMDVAALVLVGAIVVSGFFLEGAKISSQADFHRMVEEYHDPTETEEMAALEALWVAEYGLAAPRSYFKYTAEQLEMGREVNDLSCMGCHARPQSAVVGYAFSRLLTPFNRSKDGGGLASFAYWLHVMLCLGALAWLPFGKMRHVVTTLLSSIADRYAGPTPDIRLHAVKRMLALDACMRCGLCSDNCSVGLCADILHNRYILPSEKLAALNGRPLNRKDRSRKLLEGLTVCTTCLRCTGICPAGIDLQDLWDAVREDLLGHGGVDVFALSPLGIHRSEAFADSFGATQDGLEALRRDAFAEARVRDVFNTGEYGGFLRLAPDNGAFRLCFNCKACTSSCPIVGLEGLDGLGLAPHQIIHATALGLDDLVASSRMLWACLGCYRCQDNCPQGVRVTDVLYIHKNKALARIKGVQPGMEG